MRNLGVVIDYMLPIIPDYFQILKDQLKHIKYQITYQPPEQHPGAWRTVCALLQDSLGKEAPTEGWKLRIHNIMTDKEAVPNSRNS